MDGSFVIIIVMSAEVEYSRSVEKRDVQHIMILLAIALIIGVYMVASTVLICEDGVFYIEQAQKFSEDPVAVAREHPPAYPFLVSIIHRIVAFFGGSSFHTWIYSAQCGTLLCRLLALMPLYFIGKFMVGPIRSFWGILILVILPYPAQIGCDVVREWLHILFMSMGFLLLLRGSRRVGLGAFVLAGVTAGLGSLNRMECSQIFLYGLAWLAFSLIWGNRDVSRRRIVSAMLLMTLGFVVTVGPYIVLRGGVFPGRLKPFAQHLSKTTQSEPVDTGADDLFPGRPMRAGIVDSGLLRAFGNYINTICEITMYIFTLPLFIGFGSHFRRTRWSSPEKFFIGMFTVFTTIICLWLYCRRGQNSSRHVLPLIAIVIVYVPTGLQIIAGWLSGRFGVSAGDIDRVRLGRSSCLTVLLAIGFVSCLPKMLRPMRIEKAVYRQASSWLAENSPLEALIMEPDPRISFYAQRRGLRWDSDKAPKTGDYAVRMSRGKDENSRLPRNGVVIEKMLSLDFQEDDKRLVIYKLTREE